MNAIEDERDRLRRLYEGLGDEALLGLDPATLTDTAQEALAAEIPSAAEAGFRAGFDGAAEAAPFQSECIS